MGTYNRRGFFKKLIAPYTTSNSLLGSDPLFKKYANKSLPKLTKTTSSLSQYSGTWSDIQVRHLLRRTMFGVKDEDIQLLSGMTMNDAVDYMLNNVPAIPAPPVNDYNSSDYTDPTGLQSGQTWTTAPYGTGTTNLYRNSSYKAWWFSQMLNQNTSILEKMVFFWHNHFATQVYVVGDARMCYYHNVLLRANALGNYKELVRSVTKDPAMLLYLNGDQNTKNNPDENYGRELQELFTVGKYNSINYTEDDVKAASKVLTGWRVNTATFSSFFVPSEHDTSDKTFSSFYNNQIISGQTGPNGANETDELIDMIFTKQETVHFICTKLYRFFVYYNIDTNIDTNIIAPLAQLLIDTNFDIKAVLTCLLKSEHFYDTANMGCYIKTPLDFLVGTFRTFNINIPGTNVNDIYAIHNFLRDYGAQLGLDLGDPPNVAGWQPFYESPEYYEIWINSSTLPLRMAFTDMIVNYGFNASTNNTIAIDILTFFKQYNNTSDPDSLVSSLCSLLSGMDISQTRRDNLKSILLSGQTNNNYWTQAWDEYNTLPNMENTSIVLSRLRALLTTILRLPEYQLC